MSARCPTHLRSAVSAVIALQLTPCFLQSRQIYTAEEKQALALVNFAAQKEKEAKVLSDLKVSTILASRC
jgi:hypothetical protein